MIASNFVLFSLNQVLNTSFDLLLLPVSGLPYIWQIFLIALVMCVIALLIFKYTSNQSGIRQAKDKIKAYILELRIYRDDPLILLKAEGQIVAHTARYLFLATVPIAVMMLPFILMIAQVEARFAFESFNVGDQATVTVYVERGALENSAASITLPPGVVVETPVHRIYARGEARWRLRIVSPGRHRIQVGIGPEVAERTLVARSESEMVSPYIYSSSDVRSLLYPGESGQISGAITAIGLNYPRLGSTFMGLSSASWSVVGLSLLLSFFLRGLFGVTF